MSAITPSPTHELVSVVIPIYNAEKTLDACLRSVEEQTHAELEIICVNDGSSDSSARIAREHAARDSRIVIIEKTNEGYGASCNRGIAIARGTWVAIVEPDDLLEPTCYADLLACAEEHGGAAEVDVVRAPYWRVIGEGDRQERVSCPYKGRVRPSRQPFAIGDGIELLRHHPAIWSGVYRRGYLAEKGIRFPEVPGAGWADNPFLVETLCQTDRIVYTDRCVYVYFERDLNEAEALARRSPLVPLAREEHAAVERVAQILRGQGVVECTGCRYCVDGCPKRINIPELFSCLNAKRGYNEDSAGYYYRTTHTGNGHGLASECVGCGACERACPQHLPIRELLREVAAEFEGNDAK